MEDTQSHRAIHLPTFPQTDSSAFRNIRKLADTRKKNKDEIANAYYCA